MPFRVIVNGVAIECDSIEEALEIARKAGSDVSRAGGGGAGGAGGGPGKSPVNGSRWTTARVSDFFRIIKGDQRRVIDALLENSDGRTDQQLLQLLSMDDGRKLGGVITGLYKNAKKVGADPNELYEKRPITIGGKQAYEYILTASFRRAAEKHLGEK